MSRDRHIVEVIRALREGEVVSYGDVAATAGYPGRARLVGRLLAASEHLGEISADLPWWRVVTADGRLVPGLELEQSRLLRSEGVEAVGARVVNAPLGRFSRVRCP
ncbi:MAG: hypothetical protein RI958_1665 [Actinomycetota bacterium]|jgi:methylated-DNA-protein-cysteine methyltransferase-like protein